VPEWDRALDRIALQVDADELGAALDPRPQLDRAGVEQPQAPERVDHDALHRDQTVANAMRVKMLTSASGNVTSSPSRSSATVNWTSSPQRG
jgi:hypothetical protein